MCSLSSDYNSHNNYNRDKILQMQTSSEITEKEDKIQFIKTVSMFDAVVKH